jgi:glucose/mannose-6-phosphate isomerase
MTVRNVLDNLDEIRRRDRGGILPVMVDFDRQLATTVETIIDFRTDFPGEIANVVVLGMGGSAIGADMLKTFLGDELSVPFQVVRGYSVPRFVGGSTLAVASSYSGNTEETLEAFAGARASGAVTVGMGSGGILSEISAEEGIPFIRFPPGQPPRTAFTYSLFALAQVMHAYGLCSGPVADIEESVPWVSERLELLGPGNPVDANPAKALALELKGRIPVVYGSYERLQYIATRWANQFSENGKQLAYSAALPEMNHNEIVGWRNPQEGLARMVPIFLRDREDHPRIQLRADITRELLDRQLDRVMECWTDGNSWLTRMWSLVLLGDFASVYLALLNQEDPTPVEAIENLKLRLRK